MEALLSTLRHSSNLAHEPGASWSGKEPGASWSGKKPGTSSFFLVTWFIIDRCMYFDNVTFKKT
ncbi:MAG: hypothetical protein HQL02_07575 [Nitrospirae bacterium]|nr:hypothetical protein [Nitrospirota bacterium]